MMDTQKTKLHLFAHGTKAIVLFRGKQQGHKLAWVLCLVRLLSTENSKFRKCNHFYFSTSILHLYSILMILAHCELTCYTCTQYTHAHNLQRVPQI